MYSNGVTKLNAIWRKLGWRFEVPAIILIPSIVIAVMMSIPLVYLIIRVWNSSFLTIILRDQTLTIFVNSLGLAGAVTISTIVIAVPLAWLTVRTDLPGRKVWSVMTVLPLVIPSLVGGFTFVSAFGYGGLLHKFFQDTFGVTYIPKIYGFFGAWAVLTLLSYPYVLLTVRSSLLGMDPSQEEAALLLGKTTWQTFFKVTFPQLRPAIAGGGLLVALYTLSDFAAVSLLQFNSFTRAIYVYYQASFNRAYSSGLALLLVGITMIIVTFEIWSRGKARYYGSNQKLRQVSLGPWRWPALILCFVVVTLALVLPVGVSLLWLIRGLLHGETLILRWEAGLNSVYVSGIAAIFTIIAALPVAILSTRYKGKLSGALEKLTYVGFALPGIVVALSLVFFGANYMIILYQTIALLIFAYMILFFPQAMGTLRSSLLQISPNIEDVGLTMGCSRTKILMFITLPLIRPGIITGAALVFLTAMKELPATLLLSPIGFRTLTTEIWNATTEAFYIRAAGPVLLLILISSFSLWILLTQEIKNGGDRS